MNRTEDLTRNTGAPILPADTDLAYAAGDPGAGANPNVVHIAYDRNTAVRRLRLCSASIRVAIRLFA